MKKILIVGGTGTISGPIVSSLSEQEGYEVYVLNRGSSNSGLPEKVKWIQGDIHNLDEMKDMLKNKTFDCVINFIVWNEQDARDNVELFRGKTDQFIFISTVCVLNRETECNLDEKREKGNAYWSYGREKEQAEAVFLQAYEEGDFPLTIVRPTQTYSKHRIPLSVKGRSCWPVVNRMIQGKEVIVHGDGQSVWASTHADDFARGFQAVVCNPDTEGEIYQIMDARPHTWDMVYQTLADLLEVEYKPVYIGTDLLRQSRTYNLEDSLQGDKRWSCIFDTSKIKAICPDFHCDISIRKGLAMYLEYMEEYPELKVEEPEFDKWCDDTIAAYKKAMAEFARTL